MIDPVTLFSNPIGLKALRPKYKFAVMRLFILPYPINAEKIATSKPTSLISYKSTKLFFSNFWIPTLSASDGDELDRTLEDQRKVIVNREK